VFLLHAVTGSLGATARRVSVSLLFYVDSCALTHAVAAEGHTCSPGR